MKYKFKYSFYEILYGYLLNSVDLFRHLVYAYTSGKLININLRIVQ